MCRAAHLVPLSGRALTLTYGLRPLGSQEGPQSGSNPEYLWFRYNNIPFDFIDRYVYLEIFKKFEWSKVASLALDGHKYSEYISHLQDVLQNEGINFITNRKFPVESPDMSMVSLREIR